MAAEDKIGADEAQAMLDRDALNRVQRLNKGGILSDKDKRKLKGIIGKAKKRGTLATTQDDGKQTKSPDTREVSFEGSFTQKQRRRKVYTLRLKGYTMREMCAELGASSKTIVGDLKAIDELLTRTLDVSKAQEILTTKVMDLEALKDVAILSLEKAETANEVAALLNSAAKLSDSQVSLLQDAGILPRKKMELTGEGGTPLIPQTATPLAVTIVRKKEGVSPAKFRIVEATERPEQVA